MSVGKNGVITTPSFDEIITLPDGSQWAQIVHHNVKDGGNLFSSSNDYTKFVYNNSECWAAFPLIKTVTRPASNYEFLVLQEVGHTNTYEQYRFAQPKSPFDSGWADVNPSSGNITHYDSATYGGAYIMNSNVYMCFANGSNGNWFGCAAKALWGGTAGTNGYIPGYNGEQVAGWQKVYIRIINPNANIRNQIITVNDFYEI